MRLRRQESIARWSGWLALTVVTMAGGCRHARSATATATTVTAPRADDRQAPLDAEVAGLPGARAHLVPEDVFGGQLYVITAGPARGAPAMPPLILVHGLGDMGVRDFYPLLPALTRQRAVVLFDLPGFGRSGRANAQYTPDRYAAVVAQVIERYTNGPVDVLGHSMGGAIAILHAATYPQQVRRLVVVDAAGILNHEALVGHHLHRAVDPAKPLLPGLAAWALDKAAAVMDQGRKLDPVTDIVMALGPLRQQVLRGDPGTIAALGLVLHNFGPALAAVRAPTLLVWGANDNVAPMRTGQLLVDRLARSQLVVLDGVGHDPMEEAPARLLTPVERYLGAVDGALFPPVPAPTLVPMGDADCRGRADFTLAPGAYGTITLEDCARATLDGVRAARLVLRRSSARAVHTTVTGGIVAQASELVMTGGQVGVGGVADSMALDLDDSRFDLAGVVIESAVADKPYRLGPGSRLLLSVCPWRSPTGTAAVRYLQGFYGGPPTSAPTAAPAPPPAK